MVPIMLFKIVYLYSTKRCTEFNTCNQNVGTPSMFRGTRTILGGSRSQYLFETKQPVRLNKDELSENRPLQNP
jgi:hypothetical protein